MKPKSKALASHVCSAQSICAFSSAIQDPILTLYMRYIVHLLGKPESTWYAESCIWSSSRPASLVHWLPLSRKDRHRYSVKIERISDLLRCMRSTMMQVGSETLVSSLAGPIIAGAPAFTWCFCLLIVLSRIGIWTFDMVNCQLFQMVSYRLQRLSWTYLPDSVFTHRLRSEFSALWRDFSALYLNCPK